MGDSLFDRSAAEFASNSDHAISAGGHDRWRLFVDAVSHHLPKDELVLDFGCGPGRISLLVANDGYFVEGVDTSSGMIAQAQSQKFDAERVTFRVGDGAGDDIVSGRYAGVICSSVIEYVPDADRMLRNFARGLKNGGVLFLSYANRRSLWGAYSRRSLRDKHPHMELQHHFWSFAETRAIFARNGFEIVGTPVFFEAAQFDKRPGLRFLTSSVLVGTLGLVVARRVD